MNDHESQLSQPESNLPGVDVSIKSIKPVKSGGVTKGSVGPRSLERPTDAGATPVAVLDQVDAFLVDGGGLVQPPETDWSLDWWIGADDRWYSPSREASVRQRRRGTGPVLDTSIRIPSGDAVHTTFATMASGRQVQVIEVSNQSPVPVALVFALRPYGWTGSGAVPECRWISDDAIEIGEWRLSMPRQPSERALSSTADLWDVVEAGGVLSWPESANLVSSSDRAGGDDGTGDHDDVGNAETNGLVMFPLPHGTSIRVCIGPAGHGVNVDLLPGPDNVAQGWNVVVEAGGRFEFPDSGVTELAAAARSRLMLAPPDLGTQLGDSLGASNRSLVSRLSKAFARQRDQTSGSEGADLPPVEVMVALAESGHVDQPRRWLADLLEPLSIGAIGDGSPSDLSVLVDSLARTAAFVGDHETAERLLEPLARMTKQLESSESTDSTHWRRAATGLLALVEHMGQGEAAVDLRHRLGVAAMADELVVNLDRFTEMAQQAHSSGRWSSGSSGPDDKPDSLIDAARFWRASRRMVLREVVGAEQPTVELLPGFPASWRGGPVEVHDAPTLYGPVSFAIRWHGARPALLWDQGESAATLICPSLDPDWRTVEPRGETLLAGASEGLADVPAQGDSFL